MSSPELSVHSNDSGSSSSSCGRPSSSSTARRVHRHSSSGNVMLDQLLKDLGNRHTIAEDVRTSTCSPPFQFSRLGIPVSAWLLCVRMCCCCVLGFVCCGGERGGGAGYIVCCTHFPPCICGVYCRPPRPRLL